MRLAMPLRTLVGLALAAGYFSGRASWKLPKQDSVPLAARLSALPRRGVPVREAVVVHWSDHQIPFIEARSDEDLAVALGIVHVHLRWTQLEVMRRISQGRVSEIIGPLGIEIDRALRTLDLSRAVPDIVARLPEETANWLGAFCIGINHAIAEAAEEPPDFSALGLSRERWQVADVLALARLAAVDVTWLIWLALLGHCDGDVASGLWRRLAGGGGVVEPTSIAPVDQGASTVAAFIRRFVRIGSNSFAVSPARSRSHGAWLASDPHLAPTLPNPWLVAGYKSPSFHVVGLMMPGIPATLLGRNSWIAWGGTNLHAASSELIDVTGLAATEIAKRHARLRVRWWRDSELVIRDTRHGPIVSDLPFLRRGEGRAYALRWVGHSPSDEITAMLRVNRARDWREFREALTLLAVPGQALTFADREGHIGKAMAGWLPRRPPGVPVGPLLPESAASYWRSLANASDLPATLDPSDRFVACANEEPADVPFPVGYFFSSRDRIERLGQLLGGTPPLGFGEITAVQRDLLAVSSLGLRDVLVGLVRLRAESATPRIARLLRSLEAWDGRYEEHSAGALAFELLLFHLAIALLGRKRIGLYSMMWDPRALLRADIESAAPALLARAMGKALPRTLRRLDGANVWGRLHRLRLPHFIGMIPLSGRGYRFGDWAVAGGSETLMKTAHPLTGKRHFARLVATARHVSDLSDPDRNYFVLLGGEDGWLGSTTLLDQVPLWQKGEYLNVPMRPETIRARFRFLTELLP